MQVQQPRFWYLFLFSQICLFIYVCEATFADEFVPDIKSSGYKLCLNGQWQFRLDPNDIGEKEQWWKSTSTNGWKTVEVPSTYNLYEEHLQRYQGKAWYSKTFTLGKKLQKNERAIIRFLGVPIRAEVWLNGGKLGSHLFPYIPFEFDATAYLSPQADNVLTVLVDNKLLRQAIPDTSCGGWWVCGGICRDVYLEVRPDVAVTNLRLDTKMAGRKWKFDAVAIVTNCRDKSGRASVAVDIRDPAGNTVWTKTKKVNVKPGENKIALGGSLADIQPWSPQSPVLYDLMATVRADSVYSRTIKTGFRQIETRSTGVFLNGKKILIKGLSRHELLAGHGSVVPRERTLKDIEDIKELGCNFLRTAHYTQHPYLYDLCDRIGLLVWTEIPAWQSISEVLSDPEIIEKWGKPQIAEMINQYRSHPSIVVWSVGNEFSSEKPGIAEYVKQATDFVRKTDPTRLTTFASNRPRNDVCFPYVDFVAINEYSGWYYGDVNDIGPLLDWLHRKFPGKPIFVSEFGSGSTIDAASDSWPTRNQHCFSFDCQVRFLRTYLKQIFDPKRRQYVAGGLIWLYSDFDNFNDAGFYKRPPKWTNVNLKGLVTIDRTRKPSFDLVKSFFNSLDE